MNTLVKNDQVTHIENNYHMHIDKEAMTLVKENAHYTVEGERRTDILSNEHYKTDGSLHAKQKGKWLVETGDEIHFKSGSQIVLDAGDNITLKVGGNFIHISPSGVDIVGVVVNVNAGGSPGIGADLTQKAPLMPAQMTSLAGPAPFCEECQKCQESDSSNSSSSSNSGSNSGVSSANSPSPIPNPSLTGGGLSDGFCGQDQVMDMLHDQMNGRGGNLGGLSEMIGAGGIGSIAGTLGNMGGFESLGSLMGQLGLDKYGFDSAITGPIEQVVSLVGMAKNGMELEDLLGLPGGYLGGHGVPDFDFTGGGIAGKSPIKGNNNHPIGATPPFVPSMD